MAFLRSLTTKNPVEPNILNYNILKQEKRANLYMKIIMDRKGSEFKSKSIN